MDTLKLPKYNLSGLYIKLNKNLILKSTIDKIYIKEHNITIKANIKYDLYRDEISAKGYGKLSDIVLDFNVTKVDKHIKFSLQSNRFKNIKAIIDKVELSDEIKSWILEKVQTKGYRLLSLSGTGDMIDGKFEIDIDKLKANMLFMSADIHFKEKLSPIITSHFILTYADERLYFDLHDPVYEGKSLAKSDVAVKNLASDNPILIINIFMHTRFDDIMAKLINTYKVNIPVVQENGKLKAHFNAKIGLVDDVNLFLCDVEFGKGDVIIKEINLPIQSGKLHYEKGIISLKDIKLKDKYIKAKANGKIDLKAQKVDLIFDTKSIVIKSKRKKVFVLKNTKLPVTIKYKKGTKIEIPKLSLTLNRGKKYTTIKINNLRRIKPYLIDGAFIEQGGNILVKTKDFKTYTLDGVIKKLSCPFYDKRDRCKTRVKFNGKITPKNTHIYAFGKRFYYNKRKSQLKIKNINIDLKKLLKTKSKSNKSNKKMVIIGKNSHLRYGKYRLLTDSYDIEIARNGNIKAIGLAKGDIVRFNKKRNKLSIRAMRIKDKILHPLIDFDGLKGGRYSLHKSGNPKKTMKGEIIIEGGVMKDFKAYNNTLAFINTLPALAVLQDPGFSKKGFNIIDGVINYRMIGTHKIIFDSIYIKGSSATIVGKGNLNIKKGTIDMNLAVQVGRELGKVVGSLPLLGYILMGKDKSMTVGLKINGKIKKPIVETNVASDILTLPLNLIKRTLQSPSHIINQ